MDAAEGRWRQATAAVPATCGELVQGTLDGVPCLVSCPIDQYSRATVRLTKGGPWLAPVTAAKAEAALRRYLGPDGAIGCELSLHSQVPRSRGYGSSTADIGASLYAASRALGRQLEPQAAARIAVCVEPTDSSIVPGLAILDHRGATLCEPLGPPPALALLLLDPGGEVDTLAFNAHDRREVLRRLAAHHREAFSLIRHGIASGDVCAVGEAATISARAHQEMLHSPLLPAVLELARQTHALGVCRAHSGTILGVLLDPGQADVPACRRFVSDRLGDGIRVAIHRLVGGGPLPGPDEPPVAHHLAGEAEPLPGTTRTCSSQRLRRYR